MGRPAAGLTIDEIALLKELTPAELMARYPNLNRVMEGIAIFAANTASQLPSPLAAACLAFGFARATGVTDPYERSHRYLAQKHFAHLGYGQAEFMIPVSIIALQHKMDEYRRLLAPGESGGLFDATPHAEFYYRCLEAVMKLVLPKARLYAADRYEAEKTRALPQPDL